MASIESMAQLGANFVPPESHTRLAPDSLITTGVQRITEGTQTSFLQLAHHGIEVTEHALLQRLGTRGPYCMTDRLNCIPAPISIAHQRLIFPEYLSHGSCSS